MRKGSKKFIKVQKIFLFAKVKYSITLYIFHAHKYSGSFDDNL